jgi:putative zinc finger/helix-turn-helix YgiT family protein
MRRCVTCEKLDTIREVRNRYVRAFELSDGTALQFVFEDFPQRACSNCDERYYAAKDLADADHAVCRELIARHVRDPAVFKWFRKSVGLKATELAELLGVTAVTISHWETGHTEPSRAVWTLLDALQEDESEGRTTTLDRLRAPSEARVPKRPVRLTLKPA